MLRNILLLLFPQLDGSGTFHWLGQRASACLLIPLYAWVLLLALPTFAKMPSPELAAWLQSPLNALPLLLTVLVSIHHMVLGLETIIDDYIHAKILKPMCIWGLRLGSAALAILCLVAVIVLAAQ